MSTRYAIHPSVGVARLGDSEDSFCLAPETLGGLPIECDERGNALADDGAPRFVRSFKDASGRIRRQGARFGIYAYDDAHPEGYEVTLDDDAVESIELDGACRQQEAGVVPGLAARSATSCSVRRTAMPRRASGCATPRCPRTSASRSSSSIPARAA